MAGNWDIRRLYLYLVSFATLMMMVFGTVFLLQGISQFIYPEPGPDFYYPEIVNKYDELAKNDPKISAEEKEKLIAREKQLAEESRMRAEKSQEYYRIRSIINNMILVIVTLPVYMYHWRKIQKAEA